MFFRYLQLEGLLKDNLAELLGSQKLWQRIPEVLSPQQIGSFLNAPRRSDPLFLRNRALLEMLYATGCRVSEISNMRLPDVHLKERLCRCTGKGNKQRMCHMGTAAVEAVEAYLANSDLVWSPIRPLLAIVCSCHGPEDSCVARPFGS